MRENNTSAWPFAEITDGEGLDIESIFGKPSDGANQKNPFDASAAAPAAVAVAVQENTSAVSNAPAKVSTSTTVPTAEAIVDNPIAAAFEQKTTDSMSLFFLITPQKSRF